MLDDVMSRARTQGITNIRAARGLPYGDGTFDAAYLVGVLGEIPDEPTALRELRRVLKPNGRLVIGEVFFDPDFVRWARCRPVPGTPPSPSSGSSAPGSRTRRDPGRPIA
jgi:ubiquinone/menaquinone biosynthesis C-methylase UbiE